MQHRPVRVRDDTKGKENYAFVALRARFFSSRNAQT